MGGGGRPRGSSVTSRGVAIPSLRSQLEFARGCTRPAECVNHPCTCAPSFELPTQSFQFLLRARVVRSRVCDAGAPWHKPKVRLCIVPMCSGSQSPLRVLASLDDQDGTKNSIACLSRP